MQNLEQQIQKESMYEEEKKKEKKICTLFICAKHPIKL